MNATSASPAERRILVWDAPVRVFHWLMVLCFAVAFATHEGERWRLLHVTAGYTMAGLAGFRLLWGLVGTRHARFASFVRGPAAVAAYLRALFGRHPEHHLGHNPAGALAILGMLALTVVITASGWAIYNDVGAEWLEEVHEVLGNGLLLLVAVHVAGVVVASRLHHENLVAAMLTGRKLGDPAQGIAHAWRSLGAVMLVAVLGFWAWQWQAAPAAGDGPGLAAVHQDDDD